MKWLKSRHGRSFPSHSLGPLGMPRLLIAAQANREAHSAWPQAKRSLPLAIFRQALRLLGLRALEHGIVRIRSRRSIRWILSENEPGGHHLIVAQTEVE
jgi:hypothetical protein